jgi:hypothetical protein
MVNREKNICSRKIQKNKKIKKKKKKKLTKNLTGPSLFVEIAKTKE